MAYGVGLTISVDQSEVLALQKKLDDALGDTSMEEFLKTDVESYLKGRMAGRFAAGGDDVVGIWAELKPSTQKIRQALGYGPASPINIRTGDLESYLTGAPGIVSGSGDMEWEFPGPALPTDVKDKLTTAQQGSSKPHTQPRPILGMNENDSEFLTNALGLHVGEALI
jgi:hypothetical protein